jgi:hypothetical protein
VTKVRGDLNIAYDPINVVLQADIENQARGENHSVVDSLSGPAAEETLPLPSHVIATATLYADFYLLSHDC